VHHDGIIGDIHVEAASAVGHVQPHDGAPGPPAAMGLLLRSWQPGRRLQSARATFTPSAATVRLSPWVVEVI